MLILYFCMIFCFYYSHLVYILRTTPELLTTTIPRIISSLLNTNTRQSPSAKTVEMIITAIGMVVCYSSTGDGTNDIIESHLEQIYPTVLNTLRGAPSSIGIVCVTVLTRILLSTYKQPIAQ